MTNILGLVGDIVGSVVTPIMDVFQTDAKTRLINVEGAHKVAQAKIDLKVAKLSAQVDREKRISESDLSYDLQVIGNRKEGTIIGNVIILGFVLIMALTFLPSTQSSMSIGWAALSVAPWWFEFGIVGILVSTLGLKEVFRMFLGMAATKMTKKKPLIKGEQ